MSDTITMTKQEYFELKSAEIELEVLQDSLDWGYFADELYRDTQETIDAKTDSLRVELGS